MPHRQRMAGYDRRADTTASYVPFVPGAAKVDPKVAKATVTTLVGTAAHQIATPYRQVKALWSMMPWAKAAAVGVAKASAAAVPVVHAAAAMSGSPPHPTKAQINAIPDTKKAIQVASVASSPVASSPVASGGGGGFVESEEVPWRVLILGGLVLLIAGRR